MRNTAMLSTAALILAIVITVFFSAMAVRTTTSVIEDRPINPYLWNMPQPVSPAKTSSVGG
jgi:hypothetical protein